MDSAQRLLRVAGRLAQIVERWDDIAVVGHYDADGITSTAITVSALRDMGKELRFYNLKQLYSDELERIQDAADYIIFVDMGVGQLPLLRQRMERPFLILDHHEIPPGEDTPLLIHPSLVGLDGSREVSGAGISYVFYRALTGKRDMAFAAVVGAVGDVQLVDNQLIGFNRNFILRDAISTGQILAQRDLALYGRISRPLPYMFVYSSDPVLPGLTANERAVFDLLRRAGIEYIRDGQWIAYVDLDSDERRHLFTELAIYLSRHGWGERRIQSLIGEVYELLSEDQHSPLRDVREFATVLNACGRHGRPEVGVHVVLGDRGSWYEAALRLLSEHREAIRRGIEFVEQSGVGALDNVYYFHARDVIPASVVGIVAGMLYGSGVVPADRPIVAFAYDEGDYVKVSARANASLVRKGVDLSVAMRAAAEAVGGEAGGHKPAAGARIRRGDEEEFLTVIDRVIGEQIT